MKTAGASAEARPIVARLAVAACIAKVLAMLDVGSLSVTVAEAAGFTVNGQTDAVDANPGDGVCATAALPSEGVRCTFRAATMEANALAGPDIINLPSGTYSLALGTGGPSCVAATDAGGPFTLMSGTSVVGAGAASTILDGAGRCSVLTENVAATVTISGVTIQNGNGVGGGGVKVGGTLTVNDSVIRDNTVSGEQYSGAAILAGPNASLTLNRVTVENNRAPIVNSKGVIDVQGGLTITDSIFRDNGTPQGVPVIGIRAPIGRSATLTRVTVTHAGPGPHLILFNGDATVQSSSFEGGVVGIDNRGSLDLAASTIRKVASTAFGYSGGGIVNSGLLTLRQVLLAENAGSAPYNQVGGAVSVNNTTMTGNDAGAQPGAAMTPAHPAGSTYPATAGGPIPGSPASRTMAARL